MKSEQVVEIVTDHFQVLFGDEVHAPHVDTTVLWNSPGLVASLRGYPELVGLGTARYGGTIRLIVRIDESETSPQGWNVMGSFELNVPSGRLIFWAPEVDDIDKAPRIALSPGLYQGRAFSRGTEEVDDEMASTGPDEYLITLSDCT